ncbi:hypothetical protein EAI_02089 [Harpegnathos saltator]|uniref:Uncharacterized protein n=1 Tax=Harpegnathos saltator TaxID=610380 RepID=E2C6D9_HARSA|nr:hypothetical protein EAI_02089 [Harpegnathos saltator]
MQRLRKEESTVRYSKRDEEGNRITEEVTQQQAQVEELCRNIRQLREENEYLQYLIEKCRCSSERSKISLLIRATCCGEESSLSKWQDN